LPATIFHDPWQFAATCLVLALAQIVYVLFGFGSGLISVGLLALVVPDLKDLVAVLLLINLPAELGVAWGARREVRWRPILGLGAGIAVGIPIGAWLLKRGDPQLVLQILGWFLVAVGMVFFRLPGGGRRHPPAWAAPPTGLVSGVLTGLFGTGGPPLIVWYHLSAAGKAAFRGNLMTIFLLKTIVRVPVYVVAGLVSPVHLWSSLAVLPAVLAGAWIGHRLHVRISEEAFRRLVAVMLTLLGAIQLLRH
jgi:uncharacterized membrane protein YfcA